VARMGEGRNAYRVLVGKERDKSEDRGVDGRMESEWILKETGLGGCRVDSSGSG
jgi:hypothetical protein